VTPSRRKRKQMEPQQSELSLLQTKSPKSTTLRPRKNRRSTTVATIDYELSHEVIEISDDCS